MHPSYPKPAVPLTPLLGFSFPPKVAATMIPSVMEIKFSRMTPSGRYALALALEHANISADDSVLMPAYHCEAMIAPLKYLGIKPLFYCINADTSINIADIKDKINAKVKAIVVVHYFGFIQDLTDIRTLCHRYGILLIEDCAHAFFGTIDGYPIGKMGDYVIASSMKFLPIHEGGLLCSETIDLSDLKLKAPRLVFQCKSIINTLEESIYYGGLGVCGQWLGSIFSLKDKLWTALKKIKISNHDSSTGSSSSEGGYGLDESWVHNTISLPSKLIIKVTHLNDTAHRRRENYQKLHTALATLVNSHPLFENLPDNVVPWVYPLYVENPEHYFDKLKRQGVPIWRFGEYLDAEINANICPVGIEYSRHIFQFPCHQSLTHQDIDWMIKQITQTLTNA